MIAGVSFCSTGLLICLKRGQAFTLAANFLVVPSTPSLISDPVPELVNAVPGESGYYWIDRFGPFVTPVEVYLDSYDQDAGVCRVQLPN
jgi:hypothetical protein